MTINIPRLTTARDIDVSAAQAWLVEHRNAMVDDLAAFVTVESPSNDKSCLDNALRWIRDWLIESLDAGPDVMTIIDGGRYGDTLVVDLPGVGSRPLLLMGHYDTVWATGTIRDWPFQAAGSTATGPGVFDMKSGLVQMVWALRSLQKFNLSRPPICMLINGDEELGSPFSRPVIEAAAGNVSAALVLEPSQEGALKTARKGVGVFDIDVTGIEAHAGLDPTKGASAIDELARAVLHLRSLADLDVGTSVNVGTIRAALAPTSLPARPMPVSTCGFHAPRRRSASKRPSHRLRRANRA